MKIKPGGTKAAFVLAETVVSMALFGIFSAAILTGLSFGTAQVALVRDNQEATQVLVDRTEALRVLDWDTVHALPTRFTVGKYSGTVEVSDKPFRSDYEKYIAKVTFRLDWKTGSLSRSRTWTTFFSEKNLPMGPIVINIPRL